MRQVKLFAISLVELSHVRRHQQGIYVSNQLDNVASVSLSKNRQLIL